MYKLIERSRAILSKLGATRQRRQLAELYLHKNEATPSHELEIDAQNEVLTSDDLLFNILIPLPADSLFTAQFVCKKWFSLINNSIFIRCHAQQSKAVLICNCSASLKPSDHHEENARKRYYFRFLDLDDGSNSFVEYSSAVESLVIQASHDGLILATSTAQHSNNLMLINPVTRRHVVLPLNRDIYRHRVSFQSFGIAYCNNEKSYKIMHLSLSASMAISWNIMSIRTRFWRRIEEPSHHLCPDIRQPPLSIDGSLNWMSLREGCDYFVALSVQDEKFVSRNLPICRAPMDRLLEIGECLGLATYVQAEMMQVWILEGENWMKKYSIDMNVSGAGILYHPVCCWGDGKGIVIEKGNDLYVYKFESCEMKLIHSSHHRAWYPGRPRDHIAHRNTLISLHDIDL